MYRYTCVPCYMLSQPDTVVIDVRNAYETAIGRVGVVTHSLTRTGDIKSIFIATGDELRSFTERSDVWRR